MSTDHTNASSSDAFSVGSSGAYVGGNRPVSTMGLPTAADAHTDRSDAGIKFDAIEFRVLRPGSPARRLRLTGNRYTFGSAEGCSIRLSDLALRPMHAVLIRDGAKILVRAYSIPIEVNTIRMTEATLHIGDVLRLGSYQFELISVASKSHPPQAGSDSTLNPPPGDPSALFATPRRELPESDEIVWRERLRREIDQWRQRQGECDAREQRCDQREATLQGRETELWTRAESLHRRESELKQQARSLDEQQSELNLLREESATQRQRLSQVESEFNEQEKQYQDKLAVASNELSQAREQAEAAADAVAQMREQFDSLNKQIEELSNQQQQTRVHEAQLRNEHERMLGELEGQRKLAIEAQSENETLRQQAESRIAELTEELEQLRTGQGVDLEQKQAEVQQSQLLVEQLQQQLAQLEETVQESSEESTRLREDYLEACESVRQLESLVAQGNERMEGDRENWGIEADELRSAIDRLSIDLARANSEVTALSEANAELAARLQDVQCERDEARADADSRPNQAELDTLQEELDAANQRLADISRDYDDALARLADHEQSRETDVESGAEAALGLIASVAEPITDHPSDETLRNETIGPDRDEEEVWPTYHFADDKADTPIEHTQEMAAEVTLSDPFVAEETVADAEDEVVAQQSVQEPVETEESQYEPDEVPEANQWTREEVSEEEDTQRAESTESVWNLTESDEVESEPESPWNSQPASDSPWSNTEADESESSGPESGTPNAGEDSAEQEEIVESATMSSAVWNEPADTSDQEVALDADSPSSFDESVDSDYQHDEVEMTAVWRDDVTVDDESQDIIGASSPWSDSTDEEAIAAIDESCEQAWDLAGEDDTPIDDSPASKSSNSESPSEETSIDESPVGESLASMLIKDFEASESTGEDADDEVDGTYLMSSIVDHQFTEEEPQIDSEAEASPWQMEPSSLDDPDAKDEEAGSHQWSSYHDENSDDNSPVGDHSAFASHIDESESDHSAGDAWSSQVSADDDDAEEAADSSASMDRYSVDALNAQDDEDDSHYESQLSDELDNQTVAEADPIAAGEAATVPNVGPAEDDDSIEAYMNRLLRRVQGTPEGEAPQTESISLSTSTPVPTSESTVDQQEKVTHPEPVDPDAPLVPRSHAPERNSDLSAMRALANQSARSAISHSSKIQTRNIQIAAMCNLAVAGVAILAAFGACFLLSGGLLLVAWVMALIVAGISVRDAMANLAEAKRRMRSDSGKGSEDEEPGNS